MHKAVHFDWSPKPYWNFFLTENAKAAAIELTISRKSLPFMDYDPLLDRIFKIKWSAFNIGRMECFHDNTELL